jgi:hypothetical protein
LEDTQPQSRSIDTVDKHLNNFLIIVGLLLIVERVDKHVEKVDEGTEHVLAGHDVLVVEEGDEQGNHLCEADLVCGLLGDSFE